MKSLLFLALFVAVAVAANRDVRQAPPAATATAAATTIIRVENDNKGHAVNGELEPQNPEKVLQASGQLIRDELVRPIKGALSLGQGFLSG